ncbi:reverse transcriptase [Ruminococcus sp. OM08-7]|nr:reverse transcriptase [Ruminococcus sp. OM08-7]
MTGTKDLFNSICSMDNLCRAYQNAKSGKGWYKEVKQIEKRPFYYLAGLQYMLKNHLFKTSEYEIFILNEGKKKRDVYKLPFFPDRIAQWAILQVIEPFLVANMTADTYSAIPGKGIQPIVNDLRGYYKTKRVDGKKKSVWVPSILLSDEENTRYCYKIDLHHYYQSINHEVLKQKFRKVFKDPELLWLLDEIADSINTATEEDLIELSLSGEIEVDPNTGIPIGNYMSQYSGNFYLSSFDHWVKEELHVKHYYRYMDDVVIFASSKEELHEIHRKVTAYTRDYLHLNIKGNYQIFPTKVRGVDFVGYRFFGEYTLLRKSTAINFKRKMRACRKKMENNIPPTYSEWCSFNSYKGWLGNCDSYRLSKKYIEPLIDYMQDYYEKEVKGHAEVYRGFLQCR